MSLSVSNVIATVILGAILAAGVHLFRLQQSYSHNEVPLRQCPICIQQLQTGQALQELPCGHVFHKKCISIVLEKEVRPSCPSCRNTFSGG